MTAGLVLVDVQNDYFPGGRMELVGMDAATAHAAALLARFRQRGAPVVHVQHLATGEQASFFLPGTPGAEIHPSVRPAAGEPVIRKHFPNSFRDTPLEATLRSAGVRDVVICGAMSHMCIDATTRAAADLGFACWVVEDACATRGLAFGGVDVPARQVQASFMAALAAAYARVGPLEELLGLLP